MALPLVGGSFLSAFLQVLFDRMASRELVDFFKSKRLDHEHLKKLKTILISVNGVLDDAEEKQIAKHAVKLWLDELKDAVYEADDLLDEIAYEALRVKMEGGSHTEKNQVFSIFPSTFSRLTKRVDSNVESLLSERIEIVVERLEFLLNQKDALGLKEGLGERPSVNKTPTTCLVDESSVYGRDSDKEEIMNLLQPIGGDSSNVNEIDVIPIVGMGGVGKTTLAQLVYNDERMKEWFNLKAWVCVSEEFDVCKVTKDILEAVNGKKCDITTLNLLQVELMEKISGRRFLLVLDDVWNDNYADWDVLRKPLRSGARGSKIIVTTRNESVASVMGTIPSNHHLKELNDDDCWFLFAKHAFDGRNSNEFPNLVLIGKEIVRKCKGLPLAAKTLGGLLRSERNGEEWERISKSNMWDLPKDDTLPALRLSYHYLPSHLKRCFAYCAIFPKDYYFTKDELVLLWMAEGFLVQYRGIKEPQEIGDEYFNDLVSRSFFQLSSVYQSYFVIHDLINDLAKFVSGEFCFRMEGDNMCKVSNRTRHVSYAKLSNHPSTKFEGIIEAKFLRSFLSMDWLRRMDNEVKHELLFKLRRIRVLSLSQYDNIVRLPESIDKLKHLRYLDLSKTSIRKLPESVCSLYNLETLILFGCQNLLHLPTDMVKLINMYHLDIGETILQEMPSQMGKLTKLKRLTDFILGKESGSSIKELGHLQHLQGSFSIWNLQNVRDSKDAREANLKGKKHLKEIELRWDGETDSSAHDRSVLEQLQPHTNVVGLFIYGYGGTRFPDWVGDSSFTNITSLILCGCNYCSCLPPLGQLASLRELSIISFEGLVTVGAEFYGFRASSEEKPFQSLKILKFERMPQWQEWIPYGDGDESGGFPSLQELGLSDCPNLRKSLPQFLPSLSTLVINGCQQLVASIPKASPSLIVDLMDDYRDVVLDILPYSGNSLKIEKFHFANSIFEGTDPLADYASSVEDVIIRNYDPLSCFPFELFTNVRAISFKNCPNLQSLFAPERNAWPFTSLISLEIKDCNNLAAFPDGGLPALNLTSLSLWNCSKLKALPKHLHGLLPSLVVLQLGNCPELECFPEGGLPLKLTSLVIESCEKLVAARRDWNLHLLPCLSWFRIGKDPVVEAFPEETLLPASLTSLSIFGFDNLKSLEHTGLERLTSLVALTVSECPKLHYFPEEGLPRTLTYLNIWDLQNLESWDCFRLQNLHVLRELEIWNCPKITSFAEESLPSMLLSLTISNLQNLERLPDGWMQQLSVLKEFDILDCPKLQSLPGERLPSSLSSLIIYNCPLLKQRCDQHTGEHWDKISHIQHIEIDSNIIRIKD